MFVDNNMEKLKHSMSVANDWLFFVLSILYVLTNDKL